MFCAVNDIGSKNNHNILLTWDLGIIFKVSACGWNVVKATTCQPCAQPHSHFNQGTRLPHAKQSPPHSIWYMVVEGKFETCMEHRII